MKRTPVLSWLAYALTGLVATTVVAALASALVAADAARAVWVAAALAYGLQLIAFALLLALRARAEWFLAAWLGGMVLRFGALGLCAYWLSSSSALPRAATLLSLVGFVFMLLLLEPVFLRWDLRA